MFSIVAHIRRRRCHKFWKNIWRGDSQDRYFVTYNLKTLPSITKSSIVLARVFLVWWEENCDFWTLPFQAVDYSRGNYIDSTLLLRKSCNVAFTWNKNAAAKFLIKGITQIAQSLSYNLMATFIIYHKQKQHSLWW